MSTGTTLPQPFNGPAVPSQKDAAPSKLSTKPWYKADNDPETRTAAEIRLNDAMTKVRQHFESVRDDTGMYQDLEAALVDFCVERNDVVVTLSDALSEATAAVQALSGANKVRLASELPRPFNQERRRTR